MGSNSRELRISSVISLIKFLSAYIAAKQADPDYIAYFSSQRSLCLLGDPTLGIMPMSLNTMKEVANNHTDHGYSYIDELRIQALHQNEHLEAESIQVTRGSKAYYVQLLDRITAENSILRQDLLLMVSQTHRALDRMLAYGKLSNQENLARKEFREIMAHLSAIQSSRPRGQRDEI